MTTTTHRHRRPGGRHVTLTPERSATGLAAHGPAAARRRSGLGRCRPGLERHGRPRSALIVQPDANDVAAAVGFARNHGLLLSIKGGGHNIAGTALADGGLTLDMRLRGIVVDPAARTATVQPAACSARSTTRPSTAWPRRWASSPRSAWPVDLGGGPAT